jgi:hypothetical protein
MLLAVTSPAFPRCMIASEGSSLHPILVANGRRSSLNLADALIVAERTGGHVVVKWASADVPYIVKRFQFQH